MVSKLLLYSMIFVSPLIDLDQLKDFGDEFGRVDMFA